MRQPTLFAIAVSMPFLVLCIPTRPCAAEPETKKYFRPDAPGMKAYSLPDVLATADGAKIATRDD
ncbi:MAG: hypothetical protein IT426_01055 [Pirellulales bacterium]|nr:hypothetical protein [Pirellulales bacterium]